MKAFLLSFCITFIVLMMGNILFIQEPVYKYHKVTVAQGDTVWDIAGRYADSDVDIREAVFRISRANSLKDQKIFPGQVLKIPVEANSGTGMMMAVK